MQELSIIVGSRKIACKSSWERILFISLRNSCHSMRVERIVRTRLLDYQINVLFCNAEEASKEKSLLPLIHFNFSYFIFQIVFNFCLMKTFIFFVEELDHESRTPIHVLHP